MSSSKKSSRAATPQFVGETDGIVVAERKGAFEVTFPFDRQLTKMVRQLPGATFDREASCYTVPANDLELLEKSFAAIRTEARAITSDRAEIEFLAAQTGRAKQREHGSELGVDPRISGFREPGKRYTGEIVNANGRFVAQLTGFGKADGAAFISIHRTADLGHARLMKGDKISVVYDENYLGTVADLSKQKTDAQLEGDYRKELGKAISGVTLTDRGEMLGVAFDMNPVLMDRIRRLDGARFNRDDTVWEIPQANREYVLRAVQDMRNEFDTQQADIEVLKDIASSKMDGARVQRAFTKDGQESVGKIVAVTDRFALQKGGGDRFSVHFVASLSEKPEVGQDLAIKYSRGAGTVVDLNKQRAQEKALSR